MQSRILFNDSPLVVPTRLACKVGLTGAMIVQQLHYWLQHKSHEIDGRLWHYNTLEGWRANFPFWSTRTIQRALLQLEASGIISSGRFNTMAMDRTKWYTINYDRLEALSEEPSGDGPKGGKKEAAEGDKLAPTGCHRGTTNNHEITDRDYPITVPSERTRRGASGESQKQEAGTMRAAPFAPRGMKALREGTAGEFCIPRELAGAFLRVGNDVRGIRYAPERAEHLAHKYRKFLVELWGDFSREGVVPEEFFAAQFASKLLHVHIHHARTDKAWERYRRFREDFDAQESAREGARRVTDCLRSRGAVEEIETGLLNSRRLLEYQSARSRAEGPELLRQFLAVSAHPVCLLLTPWTLRTGGRALPPIPKRFQRGEDLLRRAAEADPGWRDREERVRRGEVRTSEWAGDRWDFPSEVEERLFLSVEARS